MHACSRVSFLWNLIFYAFPNRSKSFSNRSQDRFPTNFDVSYERQWLLIMWTTKIYNTDLDFDSESDIKIVRRSYTLY